MANINKYSAAYQTNTYLYTKGGEYSLNGRNYIGEYHLEGVVPKTGPIKTKDSKVLHRVYRNPDHYTYDKLFNFNVPALRHTDPIPFVYIPKEQVYEVGFDTRYFVEKSNDDVSYAVEIDKKQFDNIGKPDGIDGGLYRHTSIRWKLTGRRDDIINHNQIELYKASAIVPTITYSVRNFLEFARITLV